ncbi:MAG: DUF1566 domain-containing protein [Deltaproteobacteria bacterium]|nr:DUF1566 domain-containing protein [Deltaproteobacteria bacterium]
MTKAGWTLVRYATFLYATAALASTPQQRCDSARINAWKTYLGCVNKAVAKDAKGIIFDKSTTFARCRRSYFKIWGTFQSNAAFGTSSCVGVRFTDNGDGTVADNLSGLVWEKKTPNKFTEYPTTQNPGSITVGPDGNLWFTDGSAPNHHVVKMNTVGVFTEYATPTASSGPESITAGPDGNLWFTENIANNIGRVTTGGMFTEYPIPTANSGPESITAGPDGNLWFTEIGANAIGRVTTAGVFIEYPIPTASSGPGSITAGPDGNLWFTEYSANSIGKLTTAGVFTEYPVPTASSTPRSITAGPDGNLWFTEEGLNKIGKVTTSGMFTEYTIPQQFYFIEEITAGPDGNLWFTMPLSIWRVTTAGVFTEYPIQTGHPAFSITTGPDANLWFTQSSVGIVKVSLPISIHDQGDSYTWSTGAPYAESGTAFSGFLLAINGDAGFAGANGWRLPTLAELQTILLDTACTGGACTCASNPCIDGTLGLSENNLYWSSTTYAPDPANAWRVDFNDGTVWATNFTGKSAQYYVRAVRGGF